MFTGTIFHFAYFNDFIEKFDDIGPIETDACKGGSSSFCKQLWIISSYDRSRR